MKRCATCCQRQRRRSASKSISSGSISTICSRASPPAFSPAPVPTSFILFNNHPHLYAASVVDVSDVAEEIGTAQGGYYAEFQRELSRRQALARIPTGDHRRDDGLSEILVRRYRRHKFPETWDDLRAAGKKLKDEGRPLGQSLGQSVGDPVVFTYPFLWSFGGKEVEADGKTVAINSKETIEAVKYMAAFWKEAHDEGGLAWDDSNNNRAFLSGTISATLNGASIYIEALRKPDQYKTERAGHEGRHSACPAAQGPRGTIRLSRAACACDPDVFQEPEGGQGTAALVPRQGELRQMVQRSAKASIRVHRPNGKTTRCGTRIR